MRREKEPGDRNFITALNKLLLYNKKTRETTLKSELEAVRSYITLQQMKYDLEFYIDEGQHPEILQADMPGFNPQPIVENAILHSGADDGGRFGVEVELLANGKVAILVKNTGKPIDPEKIKDVLVQKTDVSSNGIWRWWRPDTGKPLWGQFRAEGGADGGRHERGGDLYSF